MKNEIKNTLFADMCMWYRTEGHKQSTIIYSDYDRVCLNASHISNLKVLSHEEVEGGAGVGSDCADATATIPQEPQAQVSTLLGLLLKQQFWKLNTHYDLDTVTRDHVKRVNTKQNCLDLLELNWSIQTQQKILLFDLISVHSPLTRELSV